MLDVERLVKQDRPMSTVMRPRIGLAAILVWIVGLGLSPTISLHVVLDHLPVPAPLREAAFSDVDHTHHHHGADHDHPLPELGEAQVERTTRAIHSSVAITEWNAISTTWLLTHHNLHTLSPVTQSSEQAPHLEARVLLI